MDKCSTCSTICPTCLECANGGICTKCEDGNYIDGKACSPCVQPCTSCTTATACSKCTPGYTVDVDKCVTCASKLIYCELCSSTTKCDTCASNAILNPRTDACVTCVELFSNCVECDLAACTKCSNNYKVVSGVCEAEEGSSAGLIVGIVGGLAVLGLVGTSSLYLGYFVYRKRQNSKASKDTLIS